MTRRRVITRDDLRDELLAFLHAGRELEPADEEYLVDRFVERLKEECGVQTEDPPAEQPEPRRGLPWSVVVLLAILLIFALVFAVDAVTRTAPAGVIVLGVLAYVLILPTLGVWMADRARERRWLREEESWLYYGNAPTVVVRRYPSDALFQEDASRLVDMGYEMQTLSRKGGGTRVMYVRGDRI